LPTFIIGDKEFIWLNKNTQSKTSLARVHIVLTRWLKLGRR